MQIIAITNQKGGEGKTASAINIGAGLANVGKRVLLIDMDPQANLTYSLGFEPSDKSIYRVLKDEIAIKDIINSKKPNLSVVPSSIEMASIETLFVKNSQKNSLLKNALSNIKGFDYIFIDCPPSLGLLTLNALTACNKVYVTLQCKFLSLQGLEQLNEAIQIIRKNFNHDIRIAGIIATLYNQRRNLSQVIYDDIKNRFPNALFKTYIRDNVSIAEAPGFGLDVFEYAPQSIGAQDYLSLCKEIIEREKNE